VASLFDHLCEVNAVSHNPVRGVKRPKAEGNEGKMPALGDGQARALLDAPPENTLKGKRDRAILATFLHQGLRARNSAACACATSKAARACLTCVFSARARKSGACRLTRLPPRERIHDHLQTAGHGRDVDGPLFEAAEEPGGAGEDRPARSRMAKRLRLTITAPDPAWLQPGSHTLSIKTSSGLEASGRYTAPQAFPHPDR
jgi:hypothetical protein